MKKTSKKAESVVKKAVNHMVDVELYGWPPQCATFLYQPTRPQRAKSDALKSKETGRK